MAEMSVKWCSVYLVHVAVPLCIPHLDVGHFCTGIPLLPLLEQETAHRRTHGSLWCFSRAAQVSATENLVNSSKKTGLAESISHLHSL